MKQLEIPFNTLLLLLQLCHAMAIAYVGPVRSDGLDSNTMENLCCLRQPEFHYRSTSTQWSPYGIDLSQKPDKVSRRANVAVPWLAAKHTMLYRWRD